MKYRNELDTDTGLPRKLGWRVAIWALGLLQALALGCSLYLLKGLDDVKTRLARIEGRLSMTVNPSPSVPVIATSIKSVPVP